ncbi:TonB-dependent receptor [bacterium]|nr:TonB-dependent receptor [bacterium]
MSINPIRLSPLFIPLIFATVFTAVPLAAQNVDDLFRMSLDELMKVKIISAGKRLETVDEIPASTIVITQDEIARYGYRNLSEVLEHVPGLFGIDDWMSLGMHFGVRGFYDAYNRNIIFLVNNIRQNEFVFGGSQISTMNIPVESIKRIEIVRGPMPVFYGTGAFFGVINIITHDDQGAQEGALLVGAIGSEQTYRLAAMTSIKEGPLGLHISVGLNRTAGPDLEYSRLGEGLRPGTTGRLLSEENRYFQISGYRHGFTADLSYNETSTAKTIFTQPYENYDGETWIRYMRFGMGYRKNLGNNIECSVKLQYYYFNNEMEYDLSFRDDAWEYEHTDFRMLDIESDFRWTPNPRVSWTLGINYNAGYDAHMMTDAPDFGFNRAKTHTGGDKIITNAFFSQLKYRLHPAILFVAGCRLERRLPFDLYFQNNSHMQYLDPDTLLGLPAYINYRRHDRDDIDFAPQAALIWTPSESHLVKFLYGEAINRSSFFMHYNLVRNLENPILTPEKIRTLELNILSILSPDFSIGLSLYRNDLKDLIVRSAGFDSRGDYYTFHDNLGRMVTHGIEAQVQISPTPQTGIDLALTYQSTEDLGDPQREVAYSPEYLGTMKAYWQSKNRFSIALTADYVGLMLPQYDSSLKDPSDPQSLPVGRIGDNVNGYINLGVNFRKTAFFHPKLYINFRISNLLNTDIYYPVAVYSAWTQKGTLGIGRTLMLTMGWSIPQ